MRYEGPRCFQEPIEQRYRWLRKRGYVTRAGEPIAVVGPIEQLRVAAPAAVKGDAALNDRIDDLYDRAMRKREMRMLEPLLACGQEADILPGDSTYFAEAGLCLYSPPALMNLGLCQYYGDLIPRRSPISIPAYTRGILIEPLIMWELADTEPFRELVSLFAATTFVFEAKQHGPFCEQAVRNLVLEKAKSPPTRRTAVEYAGLCLFLLQKQHGAFLEQAAASLTSVLEPEGFTGRIEEPAEQILHLKAQFETASFVPFAKGVLDRAYAERRNPFELLT